MKKITLIIALCMAMYGTSQATVDALDFQGKMTTTLRNQLSIRQGGSVLIWNTDEQEYQYASDNGVWRTFGITLAEQVKLAQIAVTQPVDLDTIEATSTANASAISSLQQAETAQDAAIALNTAKETNTDNQNLTNVLTQGADAGGAVITNLGTPINANDAATKGYVDANSGGGTADGNDFITGGNLTGTTLNLTGTGIAGATVDLSPLQGGNNYVTLTGAQTISGDKTYSGQLRIEDANSESEIEIIFNGGLSSRSLSFFDNGNISYDGSSLINIDQTLSISGNDLSITGGNTVTLPSGGSSTGLELVTENSNTGWRLIGRNPANHADIGNDAVDLTVPTFLSSAIGASGNYSAAFNQSEAAGNYSAAFNGGASSGFFSSAFNGGGASGFFSSAFNYSSAPSYAEFTVGTYNTNYTPLSTSTYNAADRLFVVGNGVDGNNRSDALIIRKDGLITAPSLTTSLIDNASNDVLVTKEWVNANAGGGTADGNDFITGGNLTGTTLNLTGTGSAGATVDLAPLQDGFEANTDSQTLSLSSSNLSISGGNTISLSSFGRLNTVNVWSAQRFASNTVIRGGGGSTAILTFDLDDVFNNGDEMNLVATANDLTYNGNSLLGTADGNDFITGGNLTGTTLNLTGTGGSGATLDLAGIRDIAYGSTLTLDGISGNPWSVFGDTSNGLRVNYDVNSYRFSPTGTPVNSEDVATKAYVDANAGGGATLTGFHSNLELTANTSLAYSNQVTGSGYRVDNLLKTGTDIDITVPNLRAEQNENYKISSIGGEANVIPDTGVTFVGKDQGANDAVRVPAFGEVALFETDTDGEFKVSGDYSWYTTTPPVTNLYPETDVMVTGTAVVGDWVVGGGSSTVDTVLDPITGTGQVLRHNVTTGSFSRTFNDISLTNGVSYTVSLDVYIPSGNAATEFYLEDFSGGGGNAVSVYPTGFDSGWVTVSATRIAANGGLRVRMHTTWSTSEALTGYYKNIVVTQN